MYISGRGLLCRGMDAMTAVIPLECQECHVVKLIHGHGLCNVCYRRLRRQRLKHTWRGECRWCHTVKSIHNKGLCSTCDRQQRIAGGPERRAAARDLDDYFRDWSRTRELAARELAAYWRELGAA